MKTTFTIWIGARNVWRSLRLYRNTTGSKQIMSKDICWPRLSRSLSRIDLEPQTDSFASVVSSLSEEVLAEIPDELADFERLIFDQLGSLDCLWSELLQLHQLGIRENHSDAIIQIVQPLLDSVFIHAQVI